MLDVEKIVRRMSVSVRPMKLKGCKGASMKTRDGYLVLLEESLPRRERLKILEHELMHIVLGHFDDRQGITEDEKEEETTGEWSLIG